MASLPRSRGAMRLPAAIVLLGLTSFFADVASEMIFPLLPIFLTGTLGAAPTFLGLVEGVADATASLLKLVTGYVAYRVEHRKWTAACGYLLAAIARPLVAVATAPWHVLAIRITDRVGKGIRSTPRDLIIAAASPAGQAGRAFGFHRAMDHAGAVVGPLIAAAVLGLGWRLRTVFLCAIIPSALSVAVIALVREPQGSSTSGLTRPENTRLERRLASYFGILLLFCIGNSSDAFLLLRAKDLGVS